MNSNTSKTVLFAPFGGQERRFKLTMGKIADLERLCGAGIGAIMIRLATHQFKACDIWETIRLSLEGGGGMTEPEATALCMSYHDDPLILQAELASRILGAAVNGIPEETTIDDAKKKSSKKENRGTSQSSTQSVAH